MFDSLRQEIETVIGSETDISRAHIQRMPYLHKVLKESKQFYLVIIVHSLKHEVQHFGYIPLFQLTLASAKRQQLSQLVVVQMDVHRF